MPSLPSAYLTQLRFSSAELSTIHRLGEARGRQDLFIRQLPAQLDTLRTHAVIESTESSNRIEGVVAAPGRVADLVVRGTEPRTRSEQEIAGYRDALQLIHESHADMRFAENVVLQLHQMLYRYQPGAGGRWKGTDNQIVERAADGSVARVRFTPTPAVATRQAMADLTAHYHDAIAGDLADPLVLLPLAILDFLCVHPFTDGNGRVGRLLSLLLLYHFDYQVGRYISLERIIEDSRETYTTRSRAVRGIGTTMRTTRTPGWTTSGVCSCAPMGSLRRAWRRCKDRRRIRCARRSLVASAPSASPTSSMTAPVSAATWYATSSARCVPTVWCASRDRAAARSGAQPLGEPCELSA